MAANPFDDLLDTGPKQSNPFDDLLQEAPRGVEYKIFPNAMKAYDERMTRPAGSVTQSMKDIGSVALAGLGDVASYEQRLQGKIFGGTRMDDPLGGYRKDKRVADDAAFDKRIEAVSADPTINPTVKHFQIRALQAEKLLRNGMTSFEEAPISSVGAIGLNAVRGAGNLVKQAIPSIKNAVLRTANLSEAAPAVERMAAGGASREAIIQGAKDTPDALASEVLQNINKTNQANTDFANGANALKQGDLNRGLNAASPRPGGPSPLYEAGKSIESTVKQAKTDLGKIFKSEQDRVLDNSGVSQGKLNWSAPTKGSLISGAKLENPAQKEVQNFLSEIKYDPEKGYGVSGNRVVDQGAIKELQNVYKNLGTARNTRDILDQRRLIDNRMNFGGSENSRLFSKGSDSDWALGQVRDRLNTVVENQFKRQIKDPAQAEALAKAWRANNENFSTVYGTLDETFDKLKNQNPEKYSNSISSIGADKLKKVLATAEQYKELQPVAQELRSGFMDNLLAKSQKDGRIDFDAFKKNWQDTDSEIKKTMLTPRQIGQINLTLKRYEMTEIGDPESVGKFFEGGKSDLRTASKQLENIANPDKRHALQELKFLDDLNGLKGPNRLSNRALSMAQAKQLGMDKSGSLPIVSDIRTGKFSAAAGAGFAAGAAMGSHVPVIGTLIGGVVGGAGGAFAQSPAGVVWMFRALNKLKPSSQIQTLRSLGTNAAEQIIGRGSLQQEAVSQPNIIPFRPRQMADDSTMIQPQAMR